MMNNKSVVDDAFSFSSDFKKELNALKKANQIGKKLSESGNYIMYDGMLFGYDIENPHCSVAFLKDKVLDPLVLFMPHVAMIDGNKLYQMMNSGKFIGYEEYCNKLSLKFEVEEEQTKEFNIEEFSKHATRYGVTDFDVIVAYQKGWQSNINVYDIYLKYMAMLEDTKKKVTVTKEYIIQYTNFDNSIMKMIMMVMKEIKNNKCILRHDLSNEDRKKFNDTDTPTEFELEDIHGDIQYIRVMKNTFPTLSSSSDLAVSIVESGYEYYNYLLTEVDNSDAVTVNIFKMYPVITKKEEDD